MPLFHRSENCALHQPEEKKQVLPTVLAMQATSVYTQQKGPIMVGFYRRLYIDPSSTYCQRLADRHAVTSSSVNPRNLQAPATTSSVPLRAASWSTDCFFLSLTNNFFFNTCRRQEQGRKMRYVMGVSVFSGTLCPFCTWQGFFYLLGYHNAPDEKHKLLYLLGLIRLALPARIERHLMRIAFCLIFATTSDNKGAHFTLMIFLHFFF